MECPLIGACQCGQVTYDLYEKPFMVFLLVTVQSAKNCLPAHLVLQQLSMPRK